ncbi:TonB-dependent receptor plug domain-containing protein [Myxococcus llanfairpwllgwyngyllgogerychwyrndrobwllllantysiliogogogochensis]|uniref:TonB-dependent receptor plug domain-containing protein n=1 Tax=Myxococcus llanfairpwllgwyngyllgogerychwyrndrobwllllantysiliogogogochensis TaxID=2590453 RepID=UPI001FEB0954|nr:TonB-dependent receptor [Myxococcus llanfairpwllgwyngyllgogerychwyrndrobwllllantysiliogogogochensis]
MRGSWCLLVLACAAPQVAWGRASPELAQAAAPGEAVSAEAEQPSPASNPSLNEQAPVAAEPGSAESSASEDAAKVSKQAEVVAGPGASTTSASSTPAEASQDEVPVARTVVTASRTQERLGETPVATEVITRADIVASGARDASELLAAHPGLEVVQTFAGASLQVQGLGPEYVLVLVDGERVAGRVAGSVDLSRLSLEDVEQVEIVKGPSSVLYGSDAVGGVVNFITRRARKPLGGELRVAYGELERLDLDATGEARGESWGLRLSGGLQRRASYDLEPADVGTTGSSLEGFDVSASGDLKGEGPLSLEGSAGFSRRTQRGVDLGVAGAVFDRASRDTSINSRLAPSWKLNSGATLRVEGSYSHFQRRYLRDQRRASALDTVEDTREQQGRLGTQLDARVGERHAFVVGAEFLGEWLVADRLETGEGDRGRASLYAQDSWTLATGPKLVVVPGARVDVDTQFGTAVTPRLAAKVDPLSWLTVRGSYGWGYRAPGFQELLLDFENPSVGYSVRGNPDLKPERSRSFSVSTEVRPSDASLIWVSAYQHALRDMIGTTLQQGGEQQLFTYVNVARARVRGGELGLRQRFPWRLSGEVAYTLTDGHDEELDRALEGQALHRLTAQATWRHREWGLETWVRAALVGKRPFYPDTDGDGVANPYKSEAYVTVDARIAWRARESLQFFVLGSNLADAGNPTDLPIPPRTFQAGLSFRL